MGFKLKQTKGALHIGKGRFFFPGEVYKTEDVPDDYREKYFDSVEDDDKNGNETVHTVASIKKLGADGQKALIFRLGGDPEETKNEEERITLILQLQEQTGE